MNYLIESSVLLGLFFLVYTLLKSDLSTGARRYLLLCSLVCATIIPVLEVDLMVASQAGSDFPQPIPANFISIDQVVGSNSILTENLDEQVMPGNKVSEADKDETSPVNWLLWLAALYGCVVIALTVRLIYGVWSVFKLKTCSKSSVHDDQMYYQTQATNLTGASFFNLLFLNEHICDAAHRKIILYHEQTHARLYHSLDILLAELYCCFFWFNPVSWMTKKEISLVTEFEADERSSSRFGAQVYSTALVDLTVQHQHNSLLQPFAQKSIHRRLSHLGKEKTKGRWYSLPAIGSTFLIGFYFFGCQSADDLFLKDYSGQSPDNIKKITTTYISHQSDTQQKDGQVIAVANFDTEGDVEDLTEYMSYPYDHKKPVEHSFLATPISKNLPHFMDGLDMKSAENHLLYGNDWSMIYMNSAHKIDPRLGFRFETDRYKREVTTMADNYPTQIFEGMRAEDGTVLQAYIKDFEYADNKIKRFTETMVMSARLFEGVKMYRSPAKVMTDTHSMIMDRTYEYEGDGLTAVKTKLRETRFTYDGTLIKSSEYYIKETLFNRRVYHYNEAGLKTKTDIYNMNNEPEYTIYYNYDFWGDSED
ncbi:MAG: M56 family metallopeptidase [Cyclobacteriaceae bacterium]